MFQDFSVVAHSITGSEVKELKWSDRELKLPDPEISSTLCSKSSREQLVCRILVTAADDSTHLIQQDG